MISSMFEEKSTVINLIAPFFMIVHKSRITLIKDFTFKPGLMVKILEDL